MPLPTPPWLYPGREVRDGRTVRLLVIEDDDSIGNPLAKGLEREGFEVQRVETGAAALAAPEADVVLLDIGLPDLDGYEVCRLLRQRSDVPIVVLTARGEEADRVTGLELGADDYVVKPFGFRELVARIRAVTRRRAPREGMPPLRVGTLAIDRRTHRVVAGEVLVELTPKEFDLLAFLAQDAGAVFERQAILEGVWGHPWYGQTKTLDVHVAALRRKLGSPEWIQTVRGVGFRLNPEL